MGFRLLTFSYGFLLPGNSSCLNLNVTMMGYPASHRQLQKRQNPPNRVIGIELHPGERMHCVLHSSAMCHRGELHDLRGGFHGAGEGPPSPPLSFLMPEPAEHGSEKRFTSDPHGYTQPPPHNIHTECCVVCWKSGLWIKDYSEFLIC